MPNEGATRRRRKVRLRLRSPCKRKWAIFLAFDWQTSLALPPRVVSSLGGSRKLLSFPFISLPPAREVVTLVRPPLPPRFLCSPLPHMRAGDVCFIAASVESNGFPLTVLHRMQMTRDLDSSLLTSNGAAHSRAADLTRTKQPTEISHARSS